MTNISTRMALQALVLILLLHSNPSAALFYARQYVEGPGNSPRAHCSPRQAHGDAIFIPSRLESMLLTRGGLNHSHQPSPWRQRMDNLDRWSRNTVRKSLQDILRFSEAQEYDIMRERRRREQELLVRKERSSNMIRTVFLVAIAISLEAWQQIPSRFLNLSFAALSLVLQLLSSITMLASVVLFASVLVAFALFFPLLQLQGEALRDDVQQSTSPMDPSSRSSRNLRKIYETFHPDREDSNANNRWNFHAFD